MTRETTRAYLAVSTCVLLWGFSGILVKSVEMEPLVASFYRLWFGVGILWTFTAARRNGGRRLDARWLRLCLLGGGLFGIHQIFFFTSLEATRVANVTIIASLQPALVAFLAAPMFREPIPWRALPYLLVAFGGIVLVIIATSGLPDVRPYGDLLAVLNLFAFTAYFLASKRIRDDLGAIEYITGMTTVAALVLSATLLATGRTPAPPSPADAAALLTVALLPGSIGHGLMNWAHPHLPAFTISTMILAVPLVATVGADVLLDEVATPLQIAGGAIALAGVAAILRVTTPPEGAFVPLPRDHGASSR